MGDVTDRRAQPNKRAPQIVEWRDAGRASGADGQDRKIDARADDKLNQLFIFFFHN